MIQRIQTIFLFLAALLSASMFVVPVLSSTEAENAGSVPLDPVFMILIGLGGVICLANIFLWKNRPLQMRVATLSMVLMAVTMVWSFIRYSRDELLQIEPGFFIPIVVIIFNILAWFYIRKDERLVKSLDRLR